MGMGIGVKVWSKGHMIHDIQQDLHLGRGREWNFWGGD